MTKTLDILEKLVAFDTVSARSNLGIVAYIEDFLRARGFAVTRVPDATGQKAGLFASIGPEGAGVLLSAHTDVVPVDGQAWQAVCRPHLVGLASGVWFARGIAWGLAKYPRLRRETQPRPHDRAAHRPLPTSTQSPPWPRPCGTSR